jgi:outer membrane protein assembly factor BamB
MRRGVRVEWVVFFALLTIVSATVAAVVGGAGRPSSSTEAAAGAPTSAILPVSPNYPTYLGNSQRDNEVDFAGSSLNVNSASALHPLWSFVTNGSIGSQAIVEDGVAYLGGENGYEYALNATSGSLLWKDYFGVVSQDTGPKACGAVRGITSTATYAKGTLYVYGGNSTVYAVDPSTGAVRWSLGLIPGSTFGYYAWSSPLVYNGNVYLGVSSQCDLPLVPAGLVEVSLSSHLVLHRFNTSTPDPNGTSIWSSPSVAAASNTIYITTGNPYQGLSSQYGESIVSLNATTLAPLSQWKVPSSETGFDTDFGATPDLYSVAGHPALVSAPDKNGWLYTWYQSNLTLVWQKKMTSESFLATTTEMNGHLFGVTPAGTLGTKKFNSTVFSIDPLTGKVLWRIGETGQVGGTYGAPLWINGVLVVNDGSRLLALDAFNGKTLYSSAPVGGMVGPISVWGSEILVGHGDELTAYIAGASGAPTDGRLAGGPAIPGPENEPMLSRVGVGRT